MVGGGVTSRRLVACSLLCSTGQVYVLNDAGEIDLNLGNYE